MSYFSRQVKKQQLAPHTTHLVYVKNTQYKAEEFITELAKDKGTNIYRLDLNDQKKICVDVNRLTHCQDLDYKIIFINNFCFNKISKDQVRFINEQCYVNDIDLVIGLFVDKEVLYTELDLLKDDLLHSCVNLGLFIDEIKLF